MENTQIMMQETLDFFKTHKEALEIPLKNPHFIIFTILTSLPLFCSLLVYEIIFQHTLIETAKILLQVPDFDIIYYYDWEQLGFAQRLIQELSSTSFLPLLLSHLVILHFLDLISLIAIVDSASSTISAGNKTTLNLKDLLQRFIKETRFKGPLITSIITLLLSTTILFGLFSMATYMYLFVCFMVLYGVLFIALLAKYIEWSAIWNMGIVISVLEEKQGEVALLSSLYLSRGNRGRGFLLELVFSMWRLSLRFSSLVLGWFLGGNRMAMVIAASAHVSLVCLWNVTKWLVFVLYFYDCKKRMREKNDIDV